MVLIWSKSEKKLEMPVGGIEFDKCYNYQRSMMCIK
jgi:hypothetical protein